MDISLKHLCGSLFTKPPSVSVSGVSSQLTVCCPPPSSKAGLRGQQELQINSSSNEQSIYSNYNWSVCSGESAYLINRHQRRFKTRSKSFWGGVASAQTSLQTYEIHDAEGFSSPAHMWWMVLLRTHHRVCLDAPGITSWVCLMETGRRRNPTGRKSPALSSNGDKNIRDERSDNMTGNWRRR